jgi:hypothetical protein
MPMKIPVGPQLVDLLLTAREAKLNVLLVGGHGVGKSAVMKTVADAVNARLIVCDLSCMEPMDIAGLPYLDKKTKRTRFAPPALLPNKNESAILLLEELARAHRALQAVCYELFSSRRAGSLVLGDGVSIVACMNPIEDGYSGIDMDDALKSRLIVVEVYAAVEPWLEWAKKDNRVHPAIRHYVEAADGVFESSNPRSWDYASRFYTTWLASADRSEETLMVALSGLLPEPLALGFLQSLNGGTTAFSAEEILGSYAVIRPAFRALVRTRRLDSVQATVAAVQRYLRSRRRAQETECDAARLKALRVFLSDLPGDMKRGMRTFFRDHDITISVPRGRLRS